MVAVKFYGPEAEALKTIQLISMENSQTIGHKLDANQIGNRKTGKPDGILGNGTFAMLEQMIFLAQRDAKIPEGEITNDLSQKNMALLDKYLRKQGMSDEKATTYMTALHTLNPPTEEPSRFAQAYKKLDVANEWRLAAKDLSPPIIVAGVQRVEITANRPTAKQEPLSDTFARTDPRRTDVQQVAATRTPNGAAQPAVYRPGTNDPTVIRNQGANAAPTTSIKMTFAEYQTIKGISPNMRSDQEKAKFAAFDAPYQAALAAAGADAKKTKLAELQKDPAAARAAIGTQKNAAEKRLKQIDDGILDRPGLKIKVNGQETTISSIRQIQAELAESWVDTSRERAMRAAVAEKYAELKKTEGYDVQNRVVIELTGKYNNFTTDNTRAIATLRGEISKIEQDVQSKPIDVAVPAELFPAPAVMASRTPTAGERPRHI